MPATALGEIPVRPITVPTRPRPAAPPTAFLPRLLPPPPTFPGPIERAAGHEGEEDGQADLVLRFGFGLALGVESDVAGGVGSGKPGFDGPGFFVGNLKLAKAEGENAGAAELAGGFGAGDGADERGTLGNGDGVIGIEDGFGDGGLDRLAVFGGLGADRLVEIGLDNPTASIVSCGIGGRIRLLPEVMLRRGCYGDRRRRRLRGNLDGVGGLDGPGRALVDALRMVGNLGVDELNEAVSLLGTGEDRDIAAGDADESVELTAEEASLRGRRRDGAKDGSTFGGVA